MATSANKPHLDPVTLEVIRNALPAISTEMAADLQRTSYNMMIYEVRDYCTALLDPNGDLICQNVGGVSHFVADLGVLVTDGMKRYGKNGFKPGDVIITNHQAVAGQHLNNIVIYTPIFFEGELLMFAMVRAPDLPEDMRQRTWVEPPLVIRRLDGQVHPEYAAVKLSFGFPP